MPEMNSNENRGAATRDRQALSLSYRGSLQRGQFIQDSGNGKFVTRLSGPSFELGSTGLLGKHTQAAPRRPETNVEPPARAQNVLLFSSGGPFRREHLSDQDDKTWLKAAIDEWEEIDDEAAEEDYPPISEAAKQNALHIIKELAKGPYPEPAIYPTPDGEVAILFQKRSVKASVLILCDSEGGGACFSTIEGKNKRARYDAVADLPDEFVRGQLLRLRVAG